MHIGPHAFSGTPQPVKLGSGWPQVAGVPTGRKPVQRELELEPRHPSVVRDPPSATSADQSKPDLSEDPLHPEDSKSASAAIQNKIAPADDGPPPSFNGLLAEALSSERTAEATPVASFKSTATAVRLPKTGAKGPRDRPDALASILPDANRAIPLTWSLTALRDETPVSEGENVPASPDGSPGTAPGAEPAKETVALASQPLAFVAQIKVSSEAPQEAIASELNPTESTPLAGQIASTPTFAGRLASDFGAQTLSPSPPLSAIQAAVNAPPIAAPPPEAKAPTAVHAEHRPVAFVEPTGEPEAAAPMAPVRDISLRMPGTGPRGVEVRLTEKAGEVRVDVRSADPELTESLRGNLHDLMSNLDRRGLTAETWHPGGMAQMHTGSAGEAGLSHHRNGSHAEDRGQQGRQRSRQQDTEDSDQPQTQHPPGELWVEAISQISEGTRNL